MANHSKTGQICPVLEWSARLDRLKNLVFRSCFRMTKGPFQNRTVWFSNGHCRCNHLSQKPNQNFLNLCIIFLPLPYIVTISYPDILIPESFDFCTNLCSVLEWSFTILFKPRMFNTKEKIVLNGLG
jgi:hypothetical protein